MTTQELVFRPGHDEKEGANQPPQNEPSAPAGDLHAMIEREGAGIQLTALDGINFNHYVIIIA